MNRKGIFIFTVALASAMADVDAQSLRVDLKQRGHEVNEDMYGIFFEEINHAGDGGLYAEMVQNRGFEEHVLPRGMVYRDGKIYAPNLPSYATHEKADWSDKWDMEAKKMLGWRVEAEGCRVAHEVSEPEYPLHKNTPNAMKLEIDGAGKVTLANSGYWGMAVKEGEKYDLRFYLNAPGYKGTLTVEIYDVEKGKTVGSETLHPASLEHWTELTATLQAASDARHCELRIVFGASGRSVVWVDYVSLFPQNTFKGRKNGLRKDVAEMLAGLQPQFMRWPGGCIVEGATLDNRVRWKETLGDPMTRRGEWSLWGYRSTYGFGYHEFLQFCEDLGMDGMFVANAALGCSFRNGDYTDDPAELERYLQDIRDAIDYAIGDPSENEWARRRAEAGHAEPFPLKYVEIGNENFGPVYVRHFNYMYGKLKKEYPQIVFINTMGGNDDEMKDVVKTDMVDPHWYVNPDFFFGANDLFDKRQRKDFTVYVGEYACNAEVGSGNMLAALSEATFMLGIERNGDMVQMASYAPLLVNVNQPNWACNLIWLDSYRTMGRASYYVQKMMAENRPDYNVQVNLTQTEPEKKSFQEGTVGVGTWNTQAEFRNIRLTAGGSTREVSIQELQGRRGTWKADAGVLAQSSSENCTMSALPGEGYEEYTIELQARKTGGAEGFFVFFGLNEASRKGYVFNIGGWGNSGTAAQTVDGFSTGNIISPTVPVTIETGRWYDLKIEIRKDAATLYVDGKEMCVAHAPSFAKQFFAAGYDEQAGETVIKVVNADTVPYKTRLVLDGAAKVNASGKVITLKADKATDENTLDEPEKIVPVEKAYSKFARKFSYTFEPLSVTVLRVKTTR